MVIIGKDSVVVEANQDGKRITEMVASCGVTTKR